MKHFVINNGDDYKKITKTLFDETIGCSWLGEVCFKTCLMSLVPLTVD